MAPLIPQTPAPQVEGWQIINGPSREILFDALRLVQEGRELKFEIVRQDDVREEIELKILAIEAIGDYIAPEGGQKWLVKAFDPSEGGFPPDRICLLNYSTQSRTGTIQYCAENMAGPSYLPVDVRMSEGFFLVISRSEAPQHFWVIGSFENDQQRSEFLCRLMNEMRDEGFASHGQDGKTYYAGIEGEPRTFTVRAYNVIPEWIGGLPPDQYQGLEMFEGYASSEEDDEDDPMLGFGNE